MDDTIVIERSYPASAADVWRLWTTKAGIESWWAPDGFAVEVQKVDLRPGGELLYAMTATGAGQVEFMQSAGLPLTTAARKTFTEVVEGKRLAYDSVIDFVPGMPPYEHATVVDLQETKDGVHVVMTVEPLHDEEWTQRLVAGRENELDNLAKVVG
ncbi:MAG: SRPBCC domain-containing protein [Gaiellaceae bacterium]